MRFHSTILCLGFLIGLNLSNYVNGEPVPADKIAQGIASLGRKLLTSLESDSAPNENLLISPANIYHAVAMVHMAAGGNTLKELSSLMEIPVDRNYTKSDVHSAVGTFYKDINTNANTDNAAIVNLADALFVQKDFPIKPDYRNNVVKQYQAQIENIDFAAGKEAANKINQWVAEKTQNRITNIVDSVEEKTKAVIASTLYFKAAWTNPFNKNKTYKGKFAAPDGQVDVQMMIMDANLSIPYVNNAGLQFESINLPYSNSAYELNIILPHANQTIKNLIPKLKDISIKQIFERKEPVGVEVRLPKTKFNVGKSLVKTFQHLGVQDLFNNQANLTDLTDANLQVSEILHKAEIEIQEAGTIATAATTVHLLTKSNIRPKPRKVVQFNVNRPFIITIYSKKTSLNLFSGIVYKPGNNL